MGNESGLTRRGFIRLGLAGAGLTAATALLQACGGAAAPASVAASASTSPGAAASSASSSAASASAKPVASASAAASTGSSSAGGASAAASAAPSSAASAKPAASATGGVKVPTYSPFQGPKPDIRGTPDGIADAYFSYPKGLVKSVPTPPGKGTDVTVFTSTPNNLPKPLDQNPTWQQINKELNANLKLNLAGTSADAAQKLGAIVAGGDLPDVLFLGPTSGASINNLPDFVNAACADLTPYLGGDAVKDFANFANIPTYVWKGPGLVFNGKIYGLPTPRPRVGNALIGHQEMLDAAGIGPIKSADDFKKALQAVSKPGAVFGLADLNSFQYTRYLAAQIFGAPNNWRLDASGKLMKDFETEEFKAGLGWLRDLWSAGLFHPNSLNYNNVTIVDDFGAAKFCFQYWGESLDGTTNWAFALKANPNAKPKYQPPFSADGKAKPQHFLGTGNFGAALLKKGTPDRIKEVLGVMNYIAAPFGSTEKLLQSFGIQDKDFTFDANGNPVAAPNGYAAAPLPLTFVTQGPPVIYSALNSKDYATMVNAAEQTYIPAGVMDPTLGLFSPADLRAAAPKQAISDAVAAVVTSRGSLTDWDQAVKDWNTKAGNQIRDEYTAAMAAAKG